MIKKTKGVIAAGNGMTAEAGRIIFEAGGNAVDAAVAACFMSFLSEPTLTSAAGGGFMLIDGPDLPETLVDFFTQSPKSNKKSPQLDFPSIELDFGDTVQEFFIGAASMAVPGNIKGLIDAQKKYGRLPLHVVMEPSILKGKEGYIVSNFQQFCINLLKPILDYSHLNNPFLKDDEKLKEEGDLFTNPDYSSFLDLLVHEGYDEFYKGQIARDLADQCVTKGGFLTLEDFEQYEVEYRQPLNVNYHDWQIITNPPPSSGGTLMSFGLKLLDKIDARKYAFNSSKRIEVMANLFSLKDLARRKSFDSYIYQKGIASDFLSDQHVQNHLFLFEKAMNRKGSTTHISCLDENGIAASVTTTVGEGSGYFIPRTGMMMNNMLGEPDLMPNGFHNWLPGQRISSMMSPTIIKKNQRPHFVLGSGGSSRIRTALIQVISNVLDYEMNLHDAIQSPRMHWENKELFVEGGIDPQIVKNLSIPNHWKLNVFDQKNMFFGGVHAVGTNKGALLGVGDERRMGVSKQVD